MCTAMLWGAGGPGRKPRRQAHSSARGTLEPNVTVTHPFTSATVHNSPNALVSPSQKSNTAVITGPNSTKPLSSRRGCPSVRQITWLPNSSSTLSASDRISQSGYAPWLGSATWFPVTLFLSLTATQRTRDGSTQSRGETLSSAYSFSIEPRELSEEELEESSVLGFSPLPTASSLPFPPSAVARGARKAGGAEFAIGTLAARTRGATHSSHHGKPSDWTVAGS